MFGFALGAGVALAGVAAASGAMRARPGPLLRAAGYRPQCTTSIVLYATHDVPSRVIDAGTGSLGFSHVAIDGCEVDAQGRDLIIDCTRVHGVRRRPVSVYENRAQVRVELTGAPAWELYGCARAKLGLDFDPSGRSGYLCAQLVHACLPMGLRRRVESFRDYAGPGVVSPNQIAAAFGIEGPNSPDQLW